MIKLTKIILIFLLPFFVMLQCKSGNTLERETLFLDTFYTKNYDNNCAMFINKNFEISVREVKEEFLNKFFYCDVFEDKNIKYNYRRQRELFFLIVISNTGKNPVEISDVKIKYNNIISESLTAKQLTENGQLFDDLIFDYFEIKSDDLCLKDTEFLKNITHYKKLSVAPGDIVIKLVSFKRIPVQYREFIISFKVKSDIIQKIVDFKFIKFEYRHSGQHFVKPKKNKD